MGDRRRRLSDVGADAGVVDVPFADGMPVRVADWNVDVDDTSLEERRDGPLPESPPSAGDSRLIGGTAEGKSNLQKLEDLVTSDELWRIVEPVQRAHREFVASRVAGCEPAYCVMDIVVLDAASWLYKTFLGAHNNLYKDLKNWQRLVDAVEEAFPDDPGRRLSATPPSRFQHYRARRGFLNGGVLEALRALYESAAVDTALRMGMFDAAAGSFSRPDKRQFMAGDLTWVSARYKRHRCDAFDPRTGRTRRHDPDADYYHHSDGKRSGSPGRGLVFLTGRNPHPNERILFGHGFMPLRGDPAILGRNDGDVCVDMFLGVLDRHEALNERVHGFVYDGAADSEAVDRLLDAGKHAVVPTRKTSTGNYAAINLGAYDFKTKDGTISRHTAIAIAGTVVVVLPDGDGDDFYVPLDCPQVKPVKRKKSCTIYGLFAMPDLDIVPPRLVGARTRIRLNSTPEERTATPHRRRARAVRTISPADPRCPKVRGLRTDVESLNSHIKNLLPYRSARLRTSQHDDSNLNILTYCMLQLTAAKAAYDQRTASNSGRPPTPPTPLQPRAGPGRIQRLPADGEPVPKAA